MSVHSLVNRVGDALLGIYVALAYGKVNGGPGHVVPDEAQFLSVGDGVLRKGSEALSQLTNLEQGLLGRTKGRSRGGGLRKSLSVRDRKRGLIVVRFARQRVDDLLQVIPAYQAGHANGVRITVGAVKGHKAVVQAIQPMILSLTAHRLQLLRAAEVIVEWAAIANRYQTVLFLLQTGALLAFNHFANPSPLTAPKNATTLSRQRDRVT